MFGWFKKGDPPRRYAKNPHTGQRVGFFSSESDRLLSGWDTTSHSIDYYLKSELTKLRARSRRMVRSNPYGKRFIEIIKSNVVGPNGIQVNAQRTKADGKPDRRANEAVESAFRDWSQSHCDYFGRSSFCELTNMTIACAAQDGEFLLEIINAGKYNFQLKAIDAELLDIDRHEPTATGEIRMGVEYDGQGRVIWYHFRKRHHLGSYAAGERYRIAADRIIHGFIPMYPDQSRGIPWMHASLESAKHLEKYQEGAIVNARASANTFNVVRSPEGEEYFGDEEDEADPSISYDNIEAGSTIDIGRRELVNINPAYPHQMYDDFVKSNLRSIASGLGISYHTLSNDLEGVNYSSIRTGVLEDRELFKMLQNWLIRVYIEPVYKKWVVFAYASGQIKLSGGQPVGEPVKTYQNATFQGRRWAWVDPQKDMASNQIYIKERLKSRSQIMREQGDDPETVWPEIAREEQLMAALGIQPIPEKPNMKPEGDDDA